MGWGEHLNNVEDFSQRGMGGCKLTLGNAIGLAVQAAERELAVLSLAQRELAV